MRGASAEKAAPPAKQVLKNPELPLSSEMGKLSLNGEKPAAASPPSASPEADAAAAVLEKLYAAASEADKSAQISELLGIVQTAGASAFSTLKLVEHLSAGMSASPKQVNKLAGALAATKAVIEHAGPAGEPWVLQLLPKIMDCAGQKDNSVSKAARELADQIFHRGVRPQAFRLLLPLLFDGMGHDKWPVKVCALNGLKALAEGHAREEVAAELYDAVPKITEAMWDSKDEVMAAAKSAMEACTATADNRDLAPFAPTIIECVLKPDLVPECIHKLAATVFVQEIKSPALAVTVPLLFRGLKERATDIRRKACTIVDNMCKMIDNPAEAVAFMPKIMPLIDKASEEIPDPEARAVAAKALETLKLLESDAMEAKQLNPDAVLSLLNPLLKDAKGVPGPAQDTALLHVASVASILIANINFEPPVWSELVDQTLAPFFGAEEVKNVGTQLRELCFKETRPKAVQEDEDEEGEDLCNMEFSLGYGAMMLLTNTRLHMKRGKRYGLCGPNGCGKSTLMKAIVNGQVEGFPPPDVLRTVYVEHDIQGSDTNTPVTDFVFADERVSDQGQTREEVVRVLQSVGFTDELLNKPISALSGGWKMKVALARAMLMKADILLLDEPTNHLDVKNVAWLEGYLNSLTEVTSMMVSHDSGFLDRVCTHITHFEKNRKLKTYRGNLSHFVQVRPEAKVYYQLASETLTFTLPEPGFLEGVKSKGKAILKMQGVSFTYPGNTVPTVTGVTLQASLSSRVAVIGPNGAGKSTIIKLLTGELKAEKGTVWKHPNMRIAYVAQHAFHHLEKHLEKTPNEYIQWRYAGGEDKEGLNKDARKISDEERKKMEEGQEIELENGKTEKLVVEDILSRRKLKSGYEYEIKWLRKTLEDNTWLPRDKLVEMGFEKLVNRMDEREALRLGTSGKALTAKQVEKVLGDMGLEAEFASHNRIQGLSGGQKVKVVLAAAMWEDPHILVLDEPTNYLDRDSLGALAAAIRTYNGGVIMISHNREFTGALCPETWLCDNGKLRREGESEGGDEKILADDDPFNADKPDVKDAFGNVIKVSKKKKLAGKDLKKYKKMKEARRKRGEDVSDSMEDWD